MHEPQLPTVSVVIPALNEADFIARCVASAVGESVKETIVVDGGSTDQTRAIAAGAGATVVKALPGRAGQMNAGAAATTGDVLLFLHADSTLGPFAVRRLRRVLARGRHRVGYFRQRIDGAHPVYRLIELGSGLRARWLGRPYGDQAMFFLRSAFQEIGGFPDSPILEDLLIARLAGRYAPFLPMSDAVTCSARRWQHDGLARRILRNWSVALAELRGESPADLLRRYECCRHLSPPRSRGHRLVTAD